MTNPSNGSGMDRDLNQRNIHEGGTRAAGEETYPREGPDPGGSTSRNVDEMNRDAEDALRRNIVPEGTPGDTEDLQGIDKSKPEQP